MNAPEKVRAAFKLSAVVDWLELTVTLIRGTQFRYVRMHLGMILQMEKPPAVVPRDATAGGVATQFAIRLQDPHAASLDNLERVMVALALEFPFACPPVVSGIEIAVDFRPRTNEADIADLVHRMQLSIDAHGNPRQYDPGKSPSPRFCNRYLNPDRPEPVTGLKIDPRFNLRIGNHGDAVQYQLYDKRTDNNGKLLAPNQRRARAEFTLSGAELANRVHGADGSSPPVTLDDLRKFRFESLAGLLHFRRFKSVEAITTTPALAKMLEKTLPWREYGITNYNIGMTAFNPERRRGAVRSSRQRAHSAHTYADAELNDIVRRSFRSLTKNFA